MVPSTCTSTRKPGGQRGEFDSFLSADHFPRLTIFFSQCRRIYPLIASQSLEVETNLGLNKIMRRNAKRIIG